MFGGVSQRDEDAEGRLRGSRSGVQSPLVGSYNRGLVLESIRLQPGASRVELAHATGLTAATVSNIARGLILDGLVAEAGQGVSTGGKPRIRLNIKAGAQYAVGLHLRSASISLALTDLDGTTVCHLQHRLRARRTTPQTCSRKRHTLRRRWFGRPVSTPRGCSG